MGLFSTGAGAATRAARDTVAAQQGRAGNLTMLADNVFSDPRREQQTTDFMGALRGQLGQNTMRGFADTARKTKFATARAGLTGGRVDVDRQGRNLEDLFRQRIADESQVQDAGNSLRTQDDMARQQWLDSIYGASNIGQGAARNFAGQQAQNANYLSALWPRLFQNTAGGIADAYGRRREASVTAGAAGGP